MPATACPQNRLGTLAFWRNRGGQSRGFSRARALIWRLAILVITAIHALALDPHQPAASYLRTTFTTEDGLAANVINAIVQTRDGFLWIGSFNGLSRFDGRRFVNLGLESVAIPRVRAMAEGPNGDLWLGTNAGLFRISKPSLNQFGKLPSTAYHLGVGSGDNVAALCVATNGTLWAGTDQGLYRWDGVRFSLIIPGRSINRIQEGIAGHILIVSSTAFFEWDGTRAIEHTEIARELGLAPNPVFHVFQDRHDGLWFSTAQGLFRRDGGSTSRVRGCRGAAYETQGDSDGNQWVSTDAGLFRVSANDVEPVAAQIRCRALFTGLDGTLWVGTNGAGLIRFKDRAVHMFTTGDGLPSDVVMAVLATHDGRLWVGTNCGGLALFDGRRFHSYLDKERLTGCIYSLAEDGNGDLWIGTYHGGVFRLRDGQFTQFSKAQGLPTDIVHGLVSAHDGSLWMATPSGAIRMQAGNFRTYTTADGLSDNYVKNVFEDGAGDIWAATKNGIDRLSGDRFYVASPATSGSLFILGADAYGRPYAGAEEGVSRLEAGRFVGFPPGLRGWYMIRSAQGLWFGAENGIYYTTSDNLRHWEQERDAPLDYAVYTRSDGMRSAECSSAGAPGLAMTPDGRIWVATEQGLAMVDAPRLRRATGKPEINIGEITIGRKSQPPGRKLDLPAGTSHVEVHFEATEISSPERIRLQYRLEGVDDTWLDAGETHVATYSAIPAGTHSFHVRATDRDGVWDRAGIVYPVTQLPYVYQTGWFRVLFLLAAVLAAWSVYRLRVRQIAAGLNARFDERIAERNRVATELHDTILQTIQATKMIADNARQGYANDPARLHEAVVNISDWLAQATT
jgi:ligand-binding sensor domain-containing protein